ncbi:hypoxanthine/guanine phosphoribosyltransferase [Candidatus Methanomassiliicoccus intestinalis]|uniref:hypoxanthine/guanine phosphoribosyltransferase n=1 Tax=Candidatus Methanomassiliicoccus intestinalis TaxID=1406512 RepID=UPI0037DCDAAA
MSSIVIAAHHSLISDLSVLINFPEDYYQVMLEKLKESLLEVPIIKKGDYSYFIHPLADGIPQIEAELLNEVTDEIVKRLPPCDLLLTPEAMGIPLATAVSLKTGLPFSIIRKKSYGLPQELCIKQQTGYAQSLMYINGVQAGQRVVIIDDIISTGGTLRAIISMLKEHGVEVAGVIVLFNKAQGAEKTSQDLGINIEPLIDVEVVNEQLQVLPSGQ